MVDGNMGWWGLWAALAFVSGSLPFSVWIGRWGLRRDIRGVGDSNPGATNVFRAGGKGLGALALILAGIGLRALTAGFTRQRVGDALLLPLSVLLMTAISAKAIWWQWRLGGPVWKGRVVRGNE